MDFPELLSNLPRVDRKPVGPSPCTPRHCYDSTDNLSQKIGCGSRSETLNLSSYTRERFERCNTILSFILNMDFIKCVY